MPVNVLLVEDTPGDRAGDAVHTMAVNW